MRQSYVDWITACECHWHHLPISVSSRLAVCIERCHTTRRPTHTWIPTWVEEQIWHWRPGQSLPAATHFESPHCPRPVSASRNVYLQPRRAQYSTRDQCQLQMKPFECSWRETCVGLRAPPLTLTSRSIAAHSSRAASSPS